MNLRAILVCVDYHDLLAVTLPYNVHHFTEVMVVTSPQDERTQHIAHKHYANVFTTDSFYADGAMFNKWRALEEGLDAFGREGWLCIMDCDVLWPWHVSLEGLQEGCLYTPLRRMYFDLPKLFVDGPPKEREWVYHPLHPQQREFAGYTQLFHANDRRLGPPPWHEVDWKHAGGADSFFQGKWPDSCKVRPGFEVLHLGPAGVNWGGRTTPYLDGSMPEGASERYQELRRMLRLRGRNPRGRFADERILR